MSLATGMVIGFALASTKGTTVSLPIVAGATIGAVAGTVVGMHVVENNPAFTTQAYAVGRFGVGVLLFSPILAAEDIARNMGMNIPKEGIMHNSEGKSVWQIWNESAK